MKKIFINIFIFIIISVIFVFSLYLKHSSYNFYLAILFLIIGSIYSYIFNNVKKTTEIKRISIVSIISGVLSLVLLIVLKKTEINQRNFALDLFYELRLTFVFIIIINYFKSFFNNPSQKKQFWILFIISSLILLIPLLLFPQAKDEFTISIIPINKIITINKEEIKDIILFMSISLFSEALISLE